MVHYLGRDCPSISRYLVAYETNTLNRTIHKLDDPAIRCSKRRIYTLRFSCALILVVGIGFACDTFRQPPNQLSSELVVSSIAFYQRNISSNLPFVCCRH